MSTLLLRLAGPMQSWGTQDRFTVRDTDLEPSKSGVVGLLCAALGRGREESVDDLAVLRMGVRVDQEGAKQRDYQTAGGTHRLEDDYGVITADGKGRRTVPSDRYYLADADFLVGLEGKDDAFLRRLHAAVADPRWQLFLGRKAFVPGVPVAMPNGLWLGVGLEESLEKFPWPRAHLELPPRSRWPRGLRLVLEDPSGYEVRLDQPQGAAFLNRGFLPRRIKTSFLTLEQQVPIRKTPEAHHVSLSVGPRP